MQATAPDFTPIYTGLREAPTHGAGDVLADERVFQRGSGEGWSDGGDV
jgi:phenylalanine-4-hydroxylase